MLLRQEVEIRGPTGNIVHQDNSGLGSSFLSKLCKMQFSRTSLVLGDRASLNYVLMVRILQALRRPSPPPEAADKHGLAK